MKKTVVSFADEAGSYRRAMKRLEDSLRDTGFDGEFKGYTSFEEIGSPPHKGPGSVHYAFKAYAIKKAIEEGGEGLYLWCDSVVFATKSIDPVFNHIKDNGYLFFDNTGFNLGQWCSDACLKKWGEDREESFKHKTIMACVLGFNIQDDNALSFLNKYIQAADDRVSYHGDWFNNSGQVSSDNRVLGSRHDQTLASILIKQLHLEITNAQETYFAYVEHAGKIPISDTVGLWSQGI